MDHRNITGVVDVDSQANRAGGSLIIELVEEGSADGGLYKVELSQ